MNMNIFLIFCSIIILISSASAGTVTRAIVYNDREANVTLFPTPYTDFDSPGYFVTEYLPNGVTFINTNADLYKIENNTLRMLKFRPSPANLQLSYTIKVPKDPGTYTIYGSFQDKNKNIGEIKAQDLSVTLTSQPQPKQDTEITIITTPQPISKSDRSHTPQLTQQEQPATVRELTAQQAQPNESESKSSFVPLLIGLVIVIFMIVFIIRKKIKKMPVTYEFVS